ncbi:uncharacterized protein C5L36_0B01410 [Pichia kudriavzevii]|uniref:Glucose-signaling factor 2 n=2 Tax=Pichia kudriavzevii TaxID=4909 RepID=A0A2U9R114_PICKU|nr:uncharacterized protein C5L36_0B01410 [Pichia kudriavzevii]AWU74876.1 hypothetical protein C5L36_0B01410 [Pichia kudriavzevii]
MSTGVVKRKVQFNEETLTEQVLELNPKTYDIYMRMNHSAEYDFCFQVNDQTTFKDLFKIFKLPMVFSPSIFYSKDPTGFSVSTHPGYLSRTGTVVFDTYAHKQKYLTRISNLNDKISQHCLPGQLIVPTFERRYFLHFSVISFFLAWLFVDLPEHIAPIKGLSPTYRLTDVICYFIKEFLDKPDIAQHFHDGIYAPVDVIEQWIYFSFHLIKCTMLYFFVWSGLFNPYSFRKPALAVTKDELIEIGWTGVKKGGKADVQDGYRSSLIQEHGTIIGIFNAGKLEYVKECFIDLQRGEGYDYKSPIDPNVEVPFKLTKELLMKERKFLATELAKMPYENAYKELKRYRKNGPLVPCVQLKEMVERKFAKIDESIRQKAYNNPVLKKNQ